MDSSCIKGLYAIADSSWNPCASLPELIGKFLMGGCKLVQLRMKKTPHPDPFDFAQGRPLPRHTTGGQAQGERGRWNDEAFEAAKEVMRFKKHFDFTFIINDYVDVAAELRADGVHVGKNDMPASEIRKYVGNRLLIGYSSHSLEEAVAAEKEGADYVALGAIFPTATKGPGHPIVGLETLRQVTQAIKIPVVAIGGIKRENYREVFAAGASAAAMITSLSTSGDISSETRWFIENQFA